MKNLLIVFGVIVVIGLMLFSWYRSGYDTAVALNERVKSSWAQVESQLQRRFDLIPNLVNTVKGFTDQEKTVILEATRLRSQWAQAQSVNEKVQTANDFSNVLSRLLVVTENYPQLKSNENFLALQTQLEGTENRITVERMRYNQAAESFNRYRNSFFGRFFVAQAGISEPATYFKTEEKAREAPQVKF